MSRNRNRENRDYVQREELTSKFATLEAEKAATTEHLARLAKSLDDNTCQLNEIKRDSAATTGRLTDLERGCNTVSRDIAALKRDYVAATGRLTTLETEQVATTGRLTTLETEQVATTTRLTGLETWKATTDTTTIAGLRNDLTASQRATKRAKRLGYAGTLLAAAAIFAGGLGVKHGMDAGRKIAGIEARMERQAAIRDDFDMSMAGKKYLVERAMLSAYDRSPGSIDAKYSVLLHLKPSTEGGEYRVVRLAVAVDEADAAALARGYENKKITLARNCRPPIGVGGVRTVEKGYISLAVQ